MTGRHRVRIGLGAASFAVALLGAGCLLPSAPVSGAQLSNSPTVANFPSSPSPFGYMPNIQITVTNTGTHPVDNLHGQPIGVFSIPSQTCTSTLGTGQSCSYSVQFCPGAVGPYSDPFVVSGDDAVTGTPVSATTQLSGIGTP